MVRSREVIRERLCGAAPALGGKRMSAEIPALITQS
jgi:hypothetical protein